MFALSHLITALFKGADVDDYRAMLWDLAWKVKRAIELRRAAASEKGKGSFIALREVNREVEAIVERVTGDPMGFGPEIPAPAQELPAGQELPELPAGQELPELPAGQELPELGAAIAPREEEEEKPHHKKRKRGGQHAD